MTTPALVPGLAGIPAAESAISYIDGKKGLLSYRGFPIELLAEQSSFEEVAWLLLYGELPTRDELESFQNALVEARTLSARMLDVLRSLPGKGHPMNALQASMAALGMFSRSREYRDPKQQDEAIVRILGATPVLIAAFERFRSGEDLCEPKPELSTAANFLWMLTGSEPDALSARVLDAALILHADHTMNASTFTARVVGSTEADPFTVTASAIGSLTGPLHGGANERVLTMLEEIQGDEDVGEWIEARLAAKRKIMGFGHRVYSVKDPRAVILQGLCAQLFEEQGRTPLYDLAVQLEEIMVKRLGDKGIYPNVDFYSGIVYSKLGIPTDTFTPIFAIARVAGWLAHWREQMADNKIFRPTQIYVGKHDQSYVPIAKR